MRYLSLLFTAFLLFIVSCSGSKEVTEPTTSSEIQTETQAAAEVQEEETKVAKEATNDWFAKSISTSPYYGTELEKAYKEFLKDKSPKKKVIVAVIDSGTDIEHEDLTANIWVNEDEEPGNNADDDNNGYVDDIHGWNFIGGPDSTHVDEDTYEVTRLYVKLKEQYADADTSSLSEEQKKGYERYLEIKKDYEAEVKQVTQNFNQVQSIMRIIDNAKQSLGITSLDSISTGQIEIKESDSPQVKQAKQIMTNLKQNGVKESDITDAFEYYKTLKEYGLNTDFDPRHIVGDDYDDLSNRYYGNNDVIGPSSDHGTHVAGIIGAVRGNGFGIDGIADVELMILRTVPMGDERDKDVANAIRYAAENGADVINMSFGKGYSPQKEYVDAAVKFADSLGVLLVSGSGNDGANVDSVETYPSKYYVSGGMAENYLTVGASSWSSDSTLAASFSNYGKKNVDIFAPGVSIYSTYPGNEYQMNSGTSMASPMVAGVAALVMSYYPELSASQVKDILMESSTKIDMAVANPGTGKTVDFSQLSVTGGILNAYEAVKLAEKQSNQ